MHSNPLIYQWTRNDLLIINQKLLIIINFSFIITRQSKVLSFDFICFQRRKKIKSKNKSNGDKFSLELKLRFLIKSIMKFRKLNFNEVNFIFLKL